MSYKHLLHDSTRHKARLLLVLLLLVADSLAALTQPWLTGRLIAVKSVFNFLSSYLVGTTGENMAARLRKRVYEYMQVLPISYFQLRRPGESLSLLSNDAAIISEFVTGTLVTLLPLLLTFFGAFFLMTRLDLQIAMAAVLLLPVYYTAMKLIGLKIRPIATDWVHAWSRMTSFVEENLSLLPVIKSFNRENLEAQRFDSRNTELLTLSRRQILVQSILVPTVSLLAGTGLLLPFWLGIRHVVMHEISPADLVSLLLYATLMTRPVSRLASVYGQVQRSRSAAARLVDFIDECSDLLEERTVILITHRPASVALTNKVFKLEDSKVIAGAVF